MYGIASNRLLNTFPTSFTNNLVTDFPEGRSQYMYDGSQITAGAPFKACWSVDVFRKGNRAIQTITAIESDFQVLNIPIFYRRITNAITEDWRTSSGFISPNVEFSRGTFIASATSSSVQAAYSLTAGINLYNSAVVSDGGTHRSDTTTYGGSKIADDPIPQTLLDYIFTTYAPAGMNRRYTPDFKVLSLKAGSGNGVSGSGADGINRTLQAYLQHRDGRADLVGVTASTVAFWCYVARGSAHIRDTNVLFDGGVVPSCSSIPVGRWVHIAIFLGGGQMYQFSSLPYMLYASDTNLNTELYVALPYVGEGFNCITPRRHTGRLIHAV